jgi:hypothetical protein
MPISHSYMIVWRPLGDHRRRPPAPRSARAGWHWRLAGTHPRVLVEAPRNMPRLPALTVQQVLLVLAAASVSSVGSADSGSCALLDVKRGGAVIGTTSLTGVKGTTAAACCAACDANPQCIAFTLSITSDTDSICWLKSNAKNSSICQHPAVSPAPMAASRSRHRRRARALPPTSAARVRDAHGRAATAALRHLRHPHPDHAAPPVCLSAGSAQGRTTAA